MVRLRSKTHMPWHPLNLLRVIFAILAVGMIIAGLTTQAQPQTTREWTLVWVVIVVLIWAMLGIGWVRT